MTTSINPGSFLRTSREFPEDGKGLAFQCSKTYLEVAQAINSRVIGFFTVNRPSVTGENWFITQNRRQQGLRQVYQFDDGNLTIPHGLKLTGISNFVRIWGTFFDGTNWQTLPYVDVVAANNQINVKVNSTNIVITKGAGTPPACMQGLVTLEWISNP